MTVALNNYYHLATFVTVVPRDYYRLHKIATVVFKDYYRFRKNKKNSSSRPPLTGVGTVVRAHAGTS